jgi:hypothetical protein
MCFENNKSKRWTQEEVEYLKKNYSIEKMSKMVEVLKRTKEHIIHKACLLKIKRKRPEPYNRKIYYVWISMMERCYNAKLPYYHRYGGRGIKVCNGWKSNYLSFQEFALSHGWKNGLTIDRIDNNGDYEPNNVRFVTLCENSRNRPSTKLTKKDVENIYFMKYNMDMRNSDIAHEYNVSYSCINSLLSGKSWKDVYQEFHNIIIS